MLYKIRCNPMNPIYSALPVPYVPASKYRRIFILLSVSLFNDLADPVFDGVEVAGFESRANAFLLA